MSETPRTDAVDDHFTGLPYRDGSHYRQMRALSMKLECENADLLRALKDLREQVDAHVLVFNPSHFNTTLATEVIDRIEK